MKNFAKIAGLLIAILLIAFFIIGASLNAIVKTGVETMGSQILGTPVSLEEADISLLSGGRNMQGILKGLLVKNPEGFHTDHAFFLPLVTIRIDRNSIFSKTVLVDHIIIDEPEITYEESEEGNNLQAIRERVEEVSAPDTETPTEEEATEAVEEKNVLVNEVVVKNAKINLSLLALQGQAITLSLQEIRLRDIGGSSDGASFEDASAQIFEGIYSGIIQTVSGSGNPLSGGGLTIRSINDLGKAAEKAGRKFLEGMLD